MKNNFWTRIEHLHFVIRSKSMLARLISRNESTEMESETTKIRYRSLSFHSKILDPPPLQFPFHAPHLPPPRGKRYKARRKARRKANRPPGASQYFMQLASSPRWHVSRNYRCNGSRIQRGRGGTLPPPLCGVATLISDVKWHPLEDKYSGSRHRCPSQRVVRTWSTFRAALFLPPVSRPLIANRKSPVNGHSLSLSFYRARAHRPSKRNEIGGQIRGNVL